jgi:RNA polymerase sigma-70 factor, ECF subfamily
VSRQAKKLLRPLQIDKIIDFQRGGKLVSATGQVTRLLAEARSGNRAAEEALIPLVYAELRRLAASYMRRERADHTFQATALVHEAYIKLLPQRVSWENRSQFFGVAAQQMRRILVDHARSRNAARRAGSEKKLRLDEALVMAKEQPAELLAVNEALDRFAQEHPRQARVVELRFFAGNTEDEVAQIVGVSVETVKRDWKFAKAWLSVEFCREQQ